MVQGAEEERRERITQGGKATMEIIKDDSGQTSALFIFVGGILLFGGIYILLGSFMQPLVDVNQQLILNPNMHYSQPHKDAMNDLFSIWWIVPIIFIILFIYWMIKHGLHRSQEDIYG